MPYESAASIGCRQETKDWLIRTLFNKGIVDESSTWEEVFRWLARHIDETFEDVSDEIKTIHKKKE